MSYSRTHRSVGGCFFFFSFPSHWHKHSVQFALPLPPPTTTTAAAPPRYSSPKRGRNWGSSFFFSGTCRWRLVEYLSPGVHYRGRGVDSKLSQLFSYLFCLLANSTFLRFWSRLRIWRWSSSGGRCITPVPWRMSQTLWQIVFLRKYIDPDYRAELYAVFSRAGGAVTR